MNTNPQCSNKVHFSTKGPSTGIAICSENKEEPLTGHPRHDTAHQCAQVKLLSATWAVMPSLP